MNLRTHVLTLGVAVAFGGGMAGPVTAAVLPAAVPVEHRLFGVLESARGTLLLLRLRSGRVVTVDAAPAFDRERVSEPLFAGKATVIEGVFAPNGVFRADAVKRTAPSPAAWGADR